MLDSLRCPHCLSEQIEEYSVYETKQVLVQFDYSPTY
jgi:hypothetical protein